MLCHIHRYGCKNEAANKLIAFRKGRQEKFYLCPHCTKAIAEYAGQAKKGVVAVISSLTAEYV